MRGLMNGRQYLRERRQDLGAVLADHDQVLDPDPAQAAQVDPRLDGDHVAGGEHVRRLRREPRVLVDEQADAVAEPVAERFSEALALDSPPRDGVDVLPTLARANV